MVIAQAHDENPVIGNDIEFMVDSEVLGGVFVADNVRLGTNAVMLKSIDETDTTWAGAGSSHFGV